LKHLVRRYASSSGEFYKDLLQLGYVGLMKAFNDYRTGFDTNISLRRQGFLL